MRRASNSDAALAIAAGLSRAELGVEGDSRAETSMDVPRSGAARESDIILGYLL
jgi:hypothetical protein